MSEGLLRDYQVGDEIGRGRFGVVRRCYSSVSGDPFAVKSIDKSRIADPLDLELAVREAKLTRLAAAGNPSAVQIHGAYEDDSSIHIVLDLLPGPDLLDWIAGRGSDRIPESEAAEVMSQLAEAIDACHRRGVAHRDVKPDNVMFDAMGRLRLVDFGSAACFGCVDDGGGGRMRGVVGTPYYVAPEVVAGREYDEKVDVWSAGVVLYMMIAGIPPFYGGSAAEIFDSVLRANLRFPPQHFGSVSPAAKDLLRRMLCKDPSRRFSAAQVLEHPWILYGAAMQSPTGSV